jgi:hypothetical protein
MTTSYKTTIFVGVIFYIFSRRWFDDMLQQSFPSLQRYSGLVMFFKIIAVMITFWLVDSFFMPSSNSSAEKKS